jgi:hypothetical protein
MRVKTDAMDHFDSSRHRMPRMTIYRKPLRYAISLLTCKLARAACFASGVNFARGALYRGSKDAFVIPVFLIDKIRKAKLISAFVLENRPGAAMDVSSYSCSVHGNEGVCQCW